MRSRGAFLFLLLAVGAVFGVAPTRGEEPSDERVATLARIRSLHERLDLAPRDSYLNYAIATIARRASIDLKREGIRFPLVPVVTGDPGQRTDLFGVATGAHAIGESLQLTELMAPDGWSSKSLEPLESLLPPRVPTHAVDLTRLGGEGIDAEARLIPKDWMFFRFENGAALAAFCREAHDWAGHVLTYYQRDARAPVELGRVFARLGLPDPRILPAAYAAIGSPFAVALADPFLREGTAVVVVLPEGPAGKLLAGLVAGDRVSADGRVTRYRAVVGGRTMLGTSRRALDVMAKLEPEQSLAESPDYREMRGRLPAGEDEAAFLFLSDPFVRRMVGPRLKILESRRLRCAAHLRTIVNASLLHADEHGSPAASIDALVEGDYLTPAVLRCPHGGAYSLEGGLEAVCSVHGRLGALRPLFDLDLAAVTEGEARAYRRYARAYEALWRQYFDPVGVRFTRVGGGWSTETVILPLADSSLYRNLARVSGGAAHEGGGGPIAPETVFHVAMKLDPSFVRDLPADPLQLGDRFGANLRDALREGFGPRVGFGLIDDRMLFDFDLAQFLGHALRWNVTRDVALAPALAAMNLPAYLTVSVKDRERVERFLEDLRRGAVREAARPDGGMFSLDVESYALDRSSDLDIETITLGIGAFRIRLYMALGESDLVVATRPEVLEEVLLRGHPDPDPTPFNLKVTVSPENWRRLRPDMLLGYEEAAREACLKRLVELEAFAPVGFDEMERALGRTTACPDDGALIETDGALRCQVHGTPAHPRQPGQPSPRNPARRLLSRTTTLTLALRFEDDGLRLGLVRK